MSNDGENVDRNRCLEHSGDNGRDVDVVAGAGEAAAVPTDAPDAFFRRGNRKGERFDGDATSASAGPDDDPCMSTL